MVCTRDNVTLATAHSPHAEDGSVLFSHRTLTRLDPGSARSSFEGLTYCLRLYSFKSVLWVFTSDVHLCMTVGGTVVREERGH